MLSETKSESFKYLLESDQDVLWGLTISTVGFQNIAPGADYPVNNHPTRYLFSTEKGRVLNEYQLLYITQGKGNFVSQSCKPLTFKAGNMFLLFPGEWHNYSPDRKTGWNEYWIGFKGINMDNRHLNGFFNKQKPLFHTGMDDEIVTLYKKAIEIAQKQNAGFQQLLAGIVNHLLGLAYSLDKHQSLEELNVTGYINTAKVIMLENFHLGIRPEDIAKQIYMSYAWFRRIFKQYTGFTPGQYLTELKIQKGKELLTHTDLSVKEIAFAVGCDNADHFCTLFKRKTQTTPTFYRNFTQGRNL